MALNQITKQNADSNAILAEEVGALGEDIDDLSKQIGQSSGSTEILAGQAGVANQKVAKLIEQNTDSVEKAVPSQENQREDRAIRERLVKAVRAIPGAISSAVDNVVNSTLGQPLGLLKKLGLASLGWLLVDPEGFNAGMKKVIAFAFETLPAYIDRFAQFVTNEDGARSQFFSELTNRIESGVMSIANDVSSAFIEQVRPTLDSSLMYIGDRFDQGVNVIGEKIETGLDTVGEVISQSVVALKTALVSAMLARAAFDIGTNALSKRAGAPSAVIAGADGNETKKTGRAAGGVVGAVGGALGAATGIGLLSAIRTTTEFNRLGGEREGAFDWWKSFLRAGGSGLTDFVASGVQTGLEVFGATDAAGAVSNFRKEFETFSRKDLGLTQLEEAQRRMEMEKDAAEAAKAQASVAAVDNSVRNATANTNVLTVNEAGCKSRPRSSSDFVFSG